MKKWIRPFKSLGLSANLILIAVIPAVFALAGTGVFFYLASGEPIEARDERGSLIALALSEISRPSMSTGDEASLRLAIKAFVSSSPLIHGVIATSFDGRLSVVVGSIAVDRSVQAYERDVIPLAPQIHDPSFGSVNSDQPIARPSRLSDPALQRLGSVKVFLAPGALTDRQIHRNYLGVAIMVLAAFTSVAIGLLLIQRVRRPLTEVIESIRSVRQGNLDVSFAQISSSEIGELQRAVVDLSAYLLKRRTDLDVLVNKRTTDLTNALIAVEKSDQERRQLIARFNDQLEDERRRTAVEIHDHMNAAMIVLKLRAEFIMHAAGKEPLDAATLAKIREASKSIIDTLGPLYGAARNIVKQLRPEVIDTLGLKVALQELIRSYSDFQTQCEITLLVPPDFPTLSRSYAMTVYRLVQEALNNVVKHSGATEVSVSLEIVAANHLCVIVSDNGKGFDLAMPSKSLGLVGMRERCFAVGGDMRLANNDGGGVRVCFDLPLVA